MIEYRESLEERGIKSAEDIERKVATHRKWLESEYGLLDSSQDVPGNSSKCPFLKPTEPYMCISTSKKAFISSVVLGLQFFWAC